MDRIAIIGCGGSGKTYLANRMAILLNLPRAHLDGIYYDADWNTLSREDFATVQRGLVARPQWIIDGNYASTLPIRLAAADTVIFSTCPRHLPRQRCSAALSLPRRPARQRRHLQPPFVEVHPLHLDVPRRGAPSHKGPPKSAQPPRPVDHFDQPPAGGPVCLATRSRVRDSDLTPIEVERR